MDESDGISAENFLTFDQMQVDPFYNTDDPKEPSPVWKHSDYVRDLIKNQKPDKDGIEVLRDEMIKQVSTIVLYQQVLELFDPAKSAGKTASFYVLLFPGEGRDNTGIKDLNDKVIGYSLSSEYVLKRQKEIKNLFGIAGDKFILVGQNYKVAYILTFDPKREEFIKRLADLDGKLLGILLDDILPKAKKEAENLPDKDETEKEYKRKRLEEIEKLRKTLQKARDKKKKYQFDIYFGLVTRGAGKTAIDTAFLLLSESLKGAGMAKYATKGQTLKTKEAKKFAIEKVDDKKVDSRGKKFDWAHYLDATEKGVDLKKFVLQKYTGANPRDYNHIFVDTVWTLAFLEYKKRYFGNPDVIRDVRKKQLVKPKMKEGVKYTFKAQKELLEFWLVILNLLDFIKDFLVDEFKNRLVLKYHNEALAVYRSLQLPPDKINWSELERIFTHDLRNQQIIVAGTASEFQFYTFAASHSDLIFFSMDIRDLGVDLMLWYDDSTGRINYEKYENENLMNETFKASDPINEQKRYTYEKVVETFRKYHKPIKVIYDKSRNKAWEMPDFNQSLRVMLGGDEVFVAASPAYGAVYPAIIGELHYTPYSNRLLNMRAAIAFSSAEIVRDPQKQRNNNQIAHDQAMALANEGSGLLKRLERTQRRIERLIEKLEANEKKKKKAQPYTEELERLGLVRLFARVKLLNPSKIFTSLEFIKLRQLLSEGDIEETQKNTEIDLELVNFLGDVVYSRKNKKLLKDAEKLEERVRLDVGLDNFYVDPPPVTKQPKEPKIIEEILDPESDKKKKKSSTAVFGA
jgi:hypothetical protein